jgi:hypothetical protein
MNEKNTHMKKKKEWKREVALSSMIKHNNHEQSQSHRYEPAFSLSLSLILKDS